MILGRPLGISDDDIDAELPATNAISPELSPPANPLDASAMDSSVHYIKLMQIESRIQKAVYALGVRSSIDYYALLSQLDEWEANIPSGVYRADRSSIPSCSADWFRLKGVEARLHLLRPLCAEQGTGSDFVPLLAQNAARGCDLQ